uniref:Male gamete fusion factor n=1 Tax=Toxoplasma gondii COUG TaxID=1074873 RepID=A0A2G8XYZ9_TOXGO|nr:male gamete fusion factor [Toxoplasma gondii COUG]
MDPPLPRWRAVAVAAFLIATICHSGVDADIPQAVSRQQICTVNGAYGKDDPRRMQCKDTILGTLRISNKEKFSFNVMQNTIDSRDKTYADVGNVGFVVTITKTPVTISLPLEYIKEVPFDYREEIYEYSRWEAGRLPEKFCYEDTTDKCSEDGKLAVHPHGKPLSWAHGRCCWCSEVLAFTHINNMKRGNFRCNWFAPPRALELVTETLYDQCEAGKIDGTVPLDRDCEREKHERLGITDRVYTLNYTTPEIFDRSVYCNTKSCLKHAIILDKDYVSVTGYECDKVGTGLDRWGDMRGEFCNLLPGTCITGQLRKFKEVDKLRIEQNLAPLYALKREFGGFPRYAPNPMNGTGFSTTGTRHYLGYDFGEQHYSDIRFEMDATDVTWLRATSPGHITFIEVPQLDACSSSTIGGCPLKAYVWNSGNEDAAFAVEVPFCIDSITKERTIDVNPITPVRTTVPADKTVVFTLTFKAISSSSLGVTCFMKLYDAQHLMLDQKTFNVTTSAAQEDKDGLSNFERFFGITRPSGPAVCPCRWYNGVCLLFRFRTCFAALKATIVSILAVVVAGVLLVFFGPVLLPFLRVGLSCFCGFARRFASALAFFLRTYCSCLVKACGGFARILSKSCKACMRFLRAKCGGVLRCSSRASGSLSKRLAQISKYCCSACVACFGRCPSALNWTKRAHGLQKSTLKAKRIKMPKIRVPAKLKAPKMPSLKQGSEAKNSVQAHDTQHSHKITKMPQRKLLGGAFTKAAVGATAAMGFFGRRTGKKKKGDTNVEAHSVTPQSFAEDARGPGIQDKLQGKADSAETSLFGESATSHAAKLSKKEKRSLRKQAKKQKRQEYQRQAAAGNAEIWAGEGEATASKKDMVSKKKGVEGSRSSTTGIADNNQSASAVTKSKPHIMKEQRETGAKRRQGECARTKEEDKRGHVEGKLKEKHSTQSQPDHPLSAGNKGTSTTQQIRSQIEHKSSIFMGNDNRTPLEVQLEGQLRKHLGQDDSDSHPSKAGKDKVLEHGQTPVEREKEGNEEDRADRGKERSNVGIIGAAGKMRKFLHRKRDEIEYQEGREEAGLDAVSISRGSTQCTRARKAKRKKQHLKEPRTPQEENPEDDIEEQDRDEEGESDTLRDTTDQGGASPQTARPELTTVVAHEPETRGEKYIKGSFSTLPSVEIEEHKEIQMIETNPSYCVSMR